MMVYLLERKKEEEEKKKGRGKRRRGGLRRGAYRTVKSLVWPPAVVVAVHRHNQIPYHSTLHYYYYKYLYNCTLFYILNNISALMMMNFFMITPLCILCTLYRQNRS